jgi:SAM-dependent methyltransferase
MGLGYALAYRTGITPWERVGALGAAQLGTVVEGIEAELGRRGSALDLGCGTGAHALELADRGWQVTGVDLVDLAVRRAQRRAAERGSSVRFLRADVTALDPSAIGTGYDLVLDVGCFHGLGDDERTAFGRGVSSVAAPDAWAVILAFAPGRRPGPRGADAASIAAALPGWSAVHREAASTDGLPRALRRSAPTWHVLRRTA